MDTNKVCGRCGGVAQRVGQTYICKCGWSLSMNQNNETTQKSIIKSLFLIATFVAFGLFHFFQWGKYGFSILTANNDKKIEICMELKKYDCMENAYFKKYKQTGDMESLEALAEMQFKRENYKESEKSYQTYFAKGGSSYKAAYYYAHSLSKNNQIDAAIQYFDSILRSRPKVLMITVVESYLEVLVSHNKIEKAKKVLSWVKKVNRNSMNTQDDIKRWEKKFNI